MLSISIPSSKIAIRIEFKRGKRQPNLAAFIALAWSLHEEPRELFDKLLTAMRLLPGTMPVLNR